MSKQNRGLRALAMLAGFSVCTAASALPVDFFNYTVSSEFVPGSAVPGTVVATPSMLSWGTGPMGPSSLVISNSPVSAPPSAPLPPDGTLAFTQIFTHNNNPINNPAVALDLVTVRTTLQLSWAVPPNPGPGAIGPVSADFTVNFLETINQPASGMCVDGTPAPAAGCPDIFVLTGNLNAFDFFDAEGNHYFVSIVPTPPVALQTLNPAFCTAAGAAPVCQGFVTPEGQATEQQFAFLITLQPLVIPEPGSLALVGMVLLALAVVRRRRRA